MTGHRPVSARAANYVTPGPVPQTAEGGVVHQDYFNGFIGQMGTQFDALSHMGRNVEIAA